MNLEEYQEYQLNMVTGQGIPLHLDQMSSIGLQLRLWGSKCLFHLFACRKLSTHKLACGVSGKCRNSMYATTEFFVASNTRVDEFPYVRENHACVCMLLGRV